MCSEINIRLQITITFESVLKLDSKKVSEFVVMRFLLCACEKLMHYTRIATAENTAHGHGA